MTANLAGGVRDKSAVGRAEQARQARQARVVAIALTGTAKASPADPVDDIPVTTWLAAAGWSAERLRAHRDAVLAVGDPWPHLVPPDARGEIGAAQAAALVRRAVTDLGLDQRPTKLRRPGPIDAGDRRLLAERPPHHGPVG